MDESKREEIRKQAKGILDSFAHSLEKVKIKGKELKREVGGFREEGNGEEGDKDFRERMFKNAPEKNKDFIIAEKKKWS